MSATTATGVTEQGLAQRLALLRDAHAVLRRHAVDGRAVEGPDVPALIERADQRLRHGSDRTVVALVGSTGSGKSSLLNALSGAQIARAGVTRPTTSVTQAVTVGDSADGLLDLLGVTRRHHLPHVEGTDGGLAGLVLLDLPDFDSVSVAHKLEVDRLVDVVDLMVWVTDPQKYGDEALHAGYLRPLHGHADVISIVLNKADTLDDTQLAACLADLERLLQQDGLEGVRPLPTSTVTPGGVDALRDLITTEVAAKHAAVQRISADIDVAADALLTQLPAPGAVDLPVIRKQLVEGLSVAAGVDALVALVQAQHRRDATLAVGWPPVRFLRRLRRAPLAQMQTTVDNPVAQAEVSRALRGAARRVAEQVGGGWDTAATTVVRDQLPEVSEALDSGLSRGIQQLRQPSGWWRPVALLHRLLLGLAAVGALWLAGLLAASSLLLIDAADVTPSLGRVPVPTVLLVGGLGIGLLLALLSTLLAGLGARRRGRMAADQLRTRVSTVADELVMDPLQTLLSDASTVTELLQQARS